MTNCASRADAARGLNVTGVHETTGWTTRWWFLLPATAVSVALGEYTLAGGLYNLLGMRIEVLTGRPYPRTTTELVFAAAFALLGLLVIVAGVGFWTRRRAAFARLALVGWCRSRSRCSGNSATRWRRREASRSTRSARGRRPCSHGRPSASHSRVAGEGTADEPGGAGRGSPRMRRRT
jgi:hypothetical protein